MRVLGIDPGLRGRTVGFAVLESPPGITVEMLDRNEPFGAASFARLLASGVLRGPRTDESILGDAPRVAEHLADVSRRFRVDLVAVEDFTYRGKNGASAAVATRVRLFVGYLCGFFEARGFRVRLVPPATWKTRIRARGFSPEKWLAARFPETTASGHAAAAVGVALAVLAASF